MFAASTRGVCAPMLPASTLVWRPLPSSSALRDTRRLLSHVRAQADFGPAVPAQRPKLRLGTMLYLTEPVTKQGFFARYVRCAREQTPCIAAAIAGVCLYSAATLAIPAGFGALIDHASRGELPLAASARLLAWFGVGAVGNFARLYFVALAGERVITTLRRRLYASIMQQPSVFFDSGDNRTGALVQRLTMDCNVVASSLTEAVTAGSKNLLQTLGSIGVMLYFSPLLTTVTVCMVPPVAVFAAVYGRYVRKLQHNMQDAIADMGTVAEERLSNIRTVKAFGTAAQEETWFMKKVTHVYALSVKMLRWNATYVALLQLVGYGAMYGVIWAGSTLVAAGHLTPGVLFSFMLYMIYSGIGMLGLTNLVTEINKGYGASLRLFDILDTADAVRAAQARTRQLTPQVEQWQIDVRDVCFAYPSRPEARIYDHLSLTIRAGCCTCVVGSSGAGKSSLALLLLKLYEPQSGQIVLDTHNLADVQTQWLHERVGYVGQEPVLFGGTIAQNIAYGVPGRHWDDPIDRWLYASIVEASRRANAHEFVTALPQGYDTFVGEAGRSLSGGQKQRIAIARALIRQPRLIILDEATSALDSESEAVVHDAIFGIIERARHATGAQRNAVLVFAHKLSMIRKADHILVLNKGRVEVEGSFEAVARNDYFCQLVGLTAAPTPMTTQQSQQTTDATATAG